MTVQASSESVAFIGEDAGSTAFAFFIFCLWTFVLLCRPQDILTFLQPVRPVLLMGILTLIFVVSRLPFFNSPPLLKERQVKYFLALVAIMILGIPFAIYRRGAFMGVFSGYVNVILYFLLFYKVVNSVERLKTVLKIGCIGSGLYALAALAFGRTEAGRLFFGTMFDPNDLSYFVLGFLPLNLIFLSRNNSFVLRLACTASFVIGVLLIVLTASRGGFLALALAMSVLIVRTRTITFPSKLIFFGVCFVVFVLSPFATGRYKTLFNIEQDYNVSSETGRLEIWKMGLKFMITHPLTGVGVGNFPNAVGNERMARGLDSAFWQTAHNSVILIGAETGVIGCFLFLLMSLNVWRILERARSNLQDPDIVRIAEMGKVGFLALFVSGFFLSQAYSFYWALYIALSAVMSQFIEIASRQKALSAAQEEPAGS